MHERVDTAWRLRVLHAAPWALAPLLLLLGVRAFSDGSVASLFQCGLAALSGSVIVGARPRSVHTAVVLEIGAGALLAALAFAFLGAGWKGATALFLLMVGVGVASWGLARLGRALGAPAFSAFGVASLVLFTAMLGLYWADSTSQWVERRSRRAYRQAVLQVDPALALAYDGANYSRLRAPTVYFDVPLASSTYDMPRAISTGGAWLMVGVTAGLVGWGIDARRRVRERVA